MGTALLFSRIAITLLSRLIASKTLPKRKKRDKNMKIKKTAKGNWR